MGIPLCFLVLLVSGIFTFLVQKIFIYYKIFDDFNHRSSHVTLATRTGGIGVFMTLFLVSVYFYFNSVELFNYSLFIPLGIMFVVGVYDDFYNADFKLKFLLQIIVAKIIIDQGFVITNYYGLFGLYEVPWILAQLTTVFVFLIIINAINFIDGIDGMAITEIIKTIILIEFFSVSPTILFPLSLILILSLIPLYYFNFKKTEKVFLGDSGSLVLGTIVAIYCFYVLGDNYTFSAEINMNKVLFTVLVLLYPLTDLLRVFIIRLKNKKSPFQPDQRHIHHLVFKKRNHLTRVFAIQITHIFIFLIIFFLTKNGF